MSICMSGNFMEYSMPKITKIQLVFSGAFRLLGERTIRRPAGLKRIFALLVPSICRSYLHRDSR